MDQRIADPLIGEPPERVQLAPAPLVRVLGQVQFAKIIKINEEQHIGNFQEAVRNHYPFIQKDVAQAIQLRTVGNAVQAGATEEVIWRLFDKSRTWRVSLNPGGLSLDTLKYTTRDEFLSRFHFLLTALAETIEPSIATRVGFRYINRLEHDLQSLENLVYPELIGVLSGSLRPQVEQTLSQAQCKTAEGRLIVRWGMLPPGNSHDGDMVAPTQGESWILDIDSFTTEDLPEDGFKPELLSALVNTMADRAYAFFRWSVKDSFLKQFGAAEG